MWGPDPDSSLSSWRGGLCERVGPSLYGVAGLSRRIFSKRKRHSGAVWGILLEQQLQSPLHPAAWRSRKGVGGIEPKSEAPERVCTLERPETTSEAPGSVCTTEGPQAPTHSHEGGESLNLWIRGCWRAGLEAGGVLV